MYNLIKIAPTPLDYNHFYCDTYPSLFFLSPFLIRKFKSKLFIEELYQKIFRIENSPISSFIKQSIEPFLKIMETFIEFCTKKIQLDQYIETFHKKNQNKIKSTKNEIQNNFKKVKEKLENLIKYPPSKISHDDHH